MHKDPKAAMSTEINTKDFWEKKIIGWEDGRYMKTEDTGGMEGFADKASKSLRFRMKAAVRLLAPHVTGKTVVEIGCGSALLAEELMELGAESYLGYDFAEVAVTRGNERLKEIGLSDNACLEVADVTNLKPLNADVIFSLGLFDWLTLEDIDHIFECSMGTTFLHSIAEKNFSLQQLIHRLYVQLAYGYKTGTYRPKYLSVDEIAAIALRYGVDQVYAYRHCELLFGALLTSFSGPEDLTKASVDLD
jgi:SAM-dependent methyltransferase